MIRLQLIITSLLITIHSIAQVSISPTVVTPNASSILDVSAPNKGLLVPRMDQAARDGISSPAHSLLIYQTNNNAGYYYNVGSPVSPQWTRLESSLSVLQRIGRIPIDTLPYIISQPGSYYVTKSLTAANGITVNASNVSIDLNGNSLKGNPGNNSVGINTPSAQSNINVYNGFITNWGKEGINFSSSHTVTLSSLTVATNGLDGILSGRNTNATLITTHTNGFDGIDLGESSILSHSVAESNFNDGIELDHGGVVNHCTAKGNAGVGIKTTNLGTLSECSAYSNTSHGFQLGTGSMANNSVSISNGGSGFYMLSTTKVSNNNARSNVRHGYEVLGNDCVLNDNNAQNNTLSGFQCSFDRCHFSSNTSNFNNVHGFEVTGNNCLLIKNSSSANVTSAYTVGGTNILGTVVTSTNINTNTNPNANISF